MMSILFICTGNSCRSQMAEGFAREMMPEWKVASAGTRPGSLNLNAVKVMEEVGIDISKQYSKPVSAVDVQPDIVVTLCDSAKSACGNFPGAKKVLHFSIEDPYDAKGTPEEVMRVYRRVRDEIRGKLVKWLNS